jgi:hypothetical protein
MDALTESYRPILYGNYDLVDRIVLNGYLKIIHGSGGFRLWWHGMYGHPKNRDDNHLMRFAIAISGHPPFKTMIMLKGHEFTAAMAKKRGLGFRKDGNCFTEINEPQQFAEVSEALNTDNALGEQRPTASQ